MKLNTLIATSLVLFFLGCSATNISPEKISQNINYLTYDQAEITSLGPVVGFGQDVFLIVNSRIQNFYKLEEVTAEAIIFSAHGQGHSPVTYAPQKGIYIQGVQPKKYTVFFKNPDGSLIDPGEVNFSEQVSSEEYFKLKKDIAGHWYAELEKNNSIIKWVTHRKEDGTYKILYKEYIGQELKEPQIERGSWRFLGGIYSTNTQFIITGQGTEEVNPLDEYLRDSYWVKYLTDKEMEYVHIKTGAEFKAIKVDSGFDF